MTSPKISVLILGSGPNAVQAQDWDRHAFSHIVTINNAWRVRPDWDHAIFPEDFPPELRAPCGPGQCHVTADQFVPLQNQFGGFVYAGGTMAFTAGYWALAALKPDVMAFIGCDMVYPSCGNTHFYGTGTADPLRDDVTLQSLEAKSARLQILAAVQGCACVNLSRDPSRLVFPRAVASALHGEALAVDADSLASAQARERDLGYMVASGRYWEETFDAAALRALDDLWLQAHGAATRAGRIAV